MTRPKRSRAEKDTHVCKLIIGIVKSGAAVIIFLLSPSSDWPNALAISRRRAIRGYAFLHFAAQAIET